MRFAFLVLRSLFLLIFVTFLSFADYRSVSVPAARQLSAQCVVLYLLLTVVFPTCRPASQGADDEWRQLELTGVKQPVQTEADNSDAEVPAVKAAKH